jgi:hypothetical protein
MPEKPMCFDAHQTNVSSHMVIAMLCATPLPSAARRSAATNRSSESMVSMSRIAGQRARQFGEVEQLRVVAA